MNTDTPLPPDEPAGQNPPEGAIIDYYLAANTPTPVTLEILDGAGKLVRRYSSTDSVDLLSDQGQVPWYWIRPLRILSAKSGMHRFVWDLHYAPAPGTRTTYPIAAIVHDTPPTPSSPWVMPGTYTVRLNANGRSMTQPLMVKMDPRVKTPAEGLQKQFAMSKQIYNAIIAVNAAIEQLHVLRPRLTGETEKRAAALEGQQGPGFGFGGGTPGAGPESLNAVSGSLRAVLSLLQGADVTPTAQTAAAVADRHRATTAVMNRWREFQLEANQALSHGQ